ncbi:MAG: phospholipid carrier-dependent glycosyltransferase [Lacunisphaera sp.]
MPRKRIWLFLGPLVAWIGSSFCLLAFHPADPSLDHDEIYWIGSSYYYDLAFVKWDWKNPAWRLLPARENPPVAKYVIGLGLAEAGHHVTTIDNLSYFYLFWLGWEKNPAAHGEGVDIEKRVKVLEAAAPGFRERVVENTHAPLTRPFVRAARDTVLVCTALASLALFLLGWRSGDWLGGLLASQLLLLHPAVVFAATHAMSDSIALMFSIAAAFAAYRWFEHFSRPVVTRFTDGLTLSIATGILLALACGAKMNSLVLVILTGALVAMVAGQKWLSRQRVEAAHASAHGLIILAVSLFGFIGINPAIIQDLRGGLAASFLEDQHTLAIQMDASNSHLSDIAAKLDAVVSMGFYHWSIFGIVLAILIWAMAFQWHQNIFRFTICWWLITFLCVTAWIPLAWPRYVIPLLAPSALLVGCFASIQIRLVALRIRRRSLTGPQFGPTTNT